MLTFEQQKKIIIFVVLTFVIIDKINAQTFSYNLQTSSLTFDYSNISNFTTARTIPKAFTLSINNSSRGRYNVFCKIQATSSQNISEIPTSIFSVKVNSANFTISSSYYQQKTIGLSDVLVGNATNRAGRTDTIYYDLILNPLSLNFEPKNYNYSFIFTVTEY